MGRGGEIGAIYQSIVGGTGVRVADYPANAAGTTLTCSGKTTGAYKFAAANANSKAVVAAAAITVNYRIVGFALDTPSATGVYRLRAGTGTGAGDAAAVWRNYSRAHVDFDAGFFVPVWWPLQIVSTVVVDGTNDAALADATSGNAAQDDTVNCALFIATALGT